LALEPAEPARPRESHGQEEARFEADRRAPGSHPAQSRFAVRGRCRAVLGGHLGFATALAGGVLDAKFRAQIALAVAHANHSEASIALYSAIAKRAGLSESEISASQQCHSEDPKRDTALKFVSELVVWRGLVGREAVSRVRAAHYRDEEIMEIAANAGLVTMVNGFERIAAERIEFP